MAIELKRLDRLQFVDLNMQMCGEGCASKFEEILDNFDHERVSGDEGIKLQHLHSKRQNMANWLDTASSMLASMKGAPKAPN